MNSVQLAPPRREPDRDTRSLAASRDPAGLRMDFDVPETTALINFPAGTSPVFPSSTSTDAPSSSGTRSLEELPVVVGRLDEAGCVIMLAGAGLSCLGLDREALLGASLVEIFPASAEAVACARQGSRASFELHAGGGDRKVRRLRVDLFPDKTEGGAIGLLAQEAPSLGTAQTEVLRAVDAERQRIGADLHDEVGQLLTGITCLSTALIERLRGRDDLAAEDAVAIAQTARDALAQVRSLAHGLAPVRLTDRGLGNALEEFAQLARRMHNVELRLNLPRHIPEMECETVMHLFRIVQEAVANAVRHGRASEVEVCLRRLAGRYKLIVSDNGSGFSAGDAPEGSGSGLRLMEYRAALIQAEFSVTSAPDCGTRIEVSFTSTPSRNHEAAC